jgi:uncharacterized surface protein with fasciclin (FAS1) repeats
MYVSRIALCVVVPVLAFASACGDDDDGSTATSETPAATATPTATPGAAAEDIVALAQANPDLSTLVDAVTAADLAETLQADGPYTVFAPTNDAFAAVGDNALTRLLRPANQDQLAEILTYHVVPDEAMAADLQDGQTLTTVQGDKLEVSVDGETVTIGGATVTQPDVDASNGIVHVIDAVLMPPEA